MDIQWTIAITEALDLIVVGWGAWPVSVRKVPKAPVAEQLCYFGPLFSRLLLQIMTVSQLNLVRENVVKVKDMSESTTGRCREPRCLSSKSFGSLKSDKCSRWEPWNYWSPWRCEPLMQWVAFSASSLSFFSFFCFF